MSSHLEHLARRLEDDPFFVACPLKLYAASERLDDDALAARLKCSKEALLSVRLCRAPASDDEQFHASIERIATVYSTDAKILMDAIRRGQALYYMTRGAPSSATLLAARDDDGHSD